MSDQNVELVRAAYESFNRGEMRAFFDALHRDIEWKPAADGIDPDTRAGHDGVESYFSTRFEVWEHLREVPEELIAVGDFVVAVVESQSRGKHSGLDVSERVAHLWTMRDGKAVRFEVFGDREAALKAAQMGPPVKD